MDPHLRSTTPGEPLSGDITPCDLVRRLLPRIGWLGLLSIALTNLLQRAGVSTVLAITLPIGTGVSVAAFQFGSWVMIHLVTISLIVWSVSCTRWIQRRAAVLGRTYAAEREAANVPVVNDGIAAGAPGRCPAAPSPV